MALFLFVLDNDPYLLRIFTTTIDSMATLSITFNLGTTPTITVEDTTTYTSPLTDITGDLIATDPLGNEIFNGTIDHDVSTTATVTPTLLNGEPVAGCYKFSYTVIDAGNRGATEITTVDYTHSRIQGDITFDVNCLLSQLTGTDATSYPANSTVVRAMQLLPPAASTLTADPAVAASTVSRSPIVTQTWTGTLANTVTIAYTNHTVVDPVSYSEEIVVKCDLDLCKLNNCIKKMVESYESALNSNPTLACSLEKDLTLVNSWAELFENAIKCGDSDLAQTAYSKIEELVECGCSCSDSDSIQQVIPVTTAGNDGVVISGVHNPTTGISTFTNSLGGTFQVNGYSTASVTDASFTPNTPTRDGLFITEPNDNAFEWEYAIFNEGKVFVDLFFGDDSSGIRERADKKFRSIAAAEAVAEDGDVIIVSSGSYTENIGAALPAAVNKITYMMSPNTVITGSADITNVTDINIYGKPEIIGAGAFITHTGAKVIDLDVDSFSGFDFIVASNAGGSGDVRVKARDVLGVGSVRLDGATNYTVSIDKFSNTEETTGVEVGASFSGHANLFIAESNAGTTTASTLISMGTAGTVTGTLCYSGRLVDDRATATSPTVQFGSGNLKLRSDIASVAAQCIEVSTGLAGELDYLGSAISTGNETVLISGSNKNVRVSGKLKSTAGKKVVFITGAPDSVNITSAELIATDANSSGIQVDSSATLMLNGVKIVSAGTESISTDTASGQIIVTGSLSANKIIGTDITNLTPFAPITIHTAIVE